MLRTPGAPLLLDVREDVERETARIEPSVHIPMADVPLRKTELPTDRAIVVYCHHGGRSQMVAAYLEQEGFTEVINLQGGIDAWAQQVDPSVPRYR
ncbi:MAG: sulfurtransferase [Thermoplasmata archaeon]|nr:sulfurtransferase [Thermoplasmata archaeon]MCI4341278.1 sulfurtransferase [Thermoplasmata archaeon]